MMMKEWIKNACVVFAIAALLGYAGRTDRNETIIYNMPEKVYVVIKHELGERATDGMIVEAYLNDRAHWEREAKKGGVMW